MRFQTGRTDRAALSLMPLIDAAFILLMFFIVTTSFNRYAQQANELLDASTELNPEQVQPLELAINAAGDLLAERAHFDRLVVRELGDGS